jgi:hypothetical protein
MVRLAAWASGIFALAHKYPPAASQMTAYLEGYVRGEEEEEEEEELKENRSNKSVAPSPADGSESSQQSDLDEFLGK